MFYLNRYVMTVAGSNRAALINPAFSSSGTAAFDVSLA
jgi:hypothetical protein